MDQVEDQVKCQVKCTKEKTCCFTWVAWTAVRLIVFVLAILVICYYVHNSGVEIVNDKIRLVLYTSKNDNGTDLNITNAKSVIPTNFIPYASTIFIIHGFQSDINDEKGVIKQVKDAYMERGDYNVIGVCWGSYAKKFNYKGVQANVKNVALKVMKFIKEIVEDPSIDLTVQHITLVGHSLGAHIAGIVGKHTKFCGVDKKHEKIPVIVGLDPAGPRFSIRDPLDRLDKSDADYVEVIHTSICSHGIYYYVKAATTLLCPFYNMKPLGIIEPIGTTDFYPNYGEQQTGCSNPFSDISGICEHSKAYELFAESLKKRSNYEAKECNGTYKDAIEKHNCISVSGTFTYHGDPRDRKNLTGIYYFQTPDDSRLLKFAYGVLVCLLYVLLTFPILYILNGCIFLVLKCCRHSNSPKTVYDWFCCKGWKCRKRKFDKVGSCEPKTPCCCFCYPCYPFDKTYLNSCLIGDEVIDENEKIKANKNAMAVPELLQGEDTQKMSHS